MKTLKIIITLIISVSFATIAYAGNITGTVTYVGDVPTRSALSIKTQDKHCLDTAKGMKSEALVVSKGKGIQNVVVYARVRGQKVTLPKTNPKVDQLNCRYLPHVIAVPTGTTIDVTSSDPIAHNVNSHAMKNEAKNFQVPNKGDVIPYKVTKAEPIKLTCDIHTWMSGYIVAVDSNHFTVTGQKDSENKWIHPDAYEKSADTGKYTLKGVAAGRVRVVAWHEELGTANKTVEVTADGDVTVDFKSTDFKKPKKK